MIRPGPVAFWLGLLLVIIVSLEAFSGLEKEITISLLVLGFLVGLLNITPEEVQEFLLAGIAIMLAAMTLFSVLVQMSFVGLYVVRFLQNIIIFTAPAVTVVALSSLWEIMRD